MSSAARRAASLGVACWLGALPAHAAISAQIPPECGSLSAFEQELEERLRGAPEAARVTLTAEVSGYQLVVEAGNQRRELHDSSCQELLRAAVVITLALLEPKAEEAAPVAQEPVRPAARAAPAAPVMPMAPVTPARPASTEPGAPHATSRSNFRFTLAAGGGVHVGTLPQATLLLDLDAQLRWTRFGAALGFRYLLPTSTLDESGHGARVGAAGAYLAGLFEPWHHVQTRLGVAAYRLSATGLGTVEPRDGGAWELSPTVGASFTPFERAAFWTSVGLEAQLNLIQPSFEILKYNEVFRVPLLSGSALARAGVVF